MTVIDFNVAKKFRVDPSKAPSKKGIAKLHTNTGTLCYVAPDILINCVYSEKVDLWSAGAVLFLMLSGEMAFPQKIEAVLIEAISAGKYEMRKDLWEAISPEAIDLVKALLQVNPEARISIDEAL